MRKTGIDAMEFMKKIPKEIWNQIDTVIWDPPYFDSDNPKHIERFNSRTKRFSEKHTILMRPQKRISILEYIENRINKVFIIYFDSREFQYDFKHKMIWNKVYPALTGSQIYRCHEYIWIREINRKLRRAAFPYINTYPNFKGKNQFGANGYRTAMKPLPLFEKLYHGCESKIILDPFAGFGNSILAADKMGLDIWACDLDSKLKWDKIPKISDWI